MSRDGWKDHKPGPCPVDSATWVEAILEDETRLSPMRADEIDWDCPGDQVVRYRISNKARRD